MRLSPEQLQHFERDDYLFFPSLFKPDEIKVLLDEVPDGPAELLRVFKRVFHRHQRGKQHVGYLPARLRLATNGRVAVRNLQRLDPGHAWKIERVGDAHAHLVPRTVG